MVNRTFNAEVAAASTSMLNVNRYQTWSKIANLKFEIFTKFTIWIKHFRTQIYENICVESQVKYQVRQQNINKSCSGASSVSSPRIIISCRYSNAAK